MEFNNIQVFEVEGGGGVVSQLRTSASATRIFFPQEK